MATQSDDIWEKYLLSRLVKFIITLISWLTHELHSWKIVC